MKTNTQKSLNLKRARNSSALNQCQSIDPSYSPITGFMRIVLLTVLALWLISNPYFAHAETNAVTSYLQEVAKSNAQELGGVMADTHWTRIEFSKTYIDPIVVVEGSVANARNTYVVGIRNVGAMGFEISLQNCNNATGIPVQENVNFSVIEKSQLPAVEGTNTKIRQQFSWGECPATAVKTGVVS
ncbi:MAG: hypothetical protein PHO08_05700 [Methylococcales bacterium]|nr:hypothetical protein [Methylococcales bacterium]